MKFHDLSLNCKIENERIRLEKNQTVEEESKSSESESFSSESIRDGCHGP